MTDGEVGMDLVCIAITRLNGNKYQKLRLTEQSHQLFEVLSSILQSKIENSLYVNNLKYNKIKKYMEG